MRFTLFAFFLLTGLSVNSQTILTIEGQTYTNSDETWLGVNIPRAIPTALTFKNNSISSVNLFGYMLQAGDEGVTATNNNLTGEIITGNKFIWSGNDMACITHGLFAGNNINAVVRYNYLDHVPMGIIRKSASNMSNTDGGVAYNIVKSGAVAVNIKGMSNVYIYNNTLYTDRTTSETWRGLVYIYTNTDVSPNSVSHGTKIFNNIFYTKYQTYCIQIGDTESLTGFESDYNIFYSETGSPLFNHCGSTKTFAQWQALGYDTHSVVINPNFKDFINFVPSARLDFGTDLGSAWKDGLSLNAKWGTTNPETTAQNGKWQVGARVYAAPVVVSVPVPIYAGSKITNEYPAILEMTYNLDLANIVPATSAFSVKVNSETRPVDKVYVSGVKVLLTLASPVFYSDAVTVAYTKPATNLLQTTAGGQAASLTAQNVTNNVVVVNPVYVSSVIENATPSRLEMTYNLTLANIASAASAFTIKVNTVTRTVSSVSISGTKVLLTLASPVVYSDAVTVAYTKPATNPLQTTAGGQAASLTAQNVTNNVVVVNPVYVSSVIENATPSRLEMTYNLTLANIIPSASAFSVNVNSVVRTVSSVSISDTKVLLTLASPVVYGDAVTVAYTKHATNPLQTEAGGQAASITAQNVINNVAAPIPAFVSSVIENATPSRLEMTYNLTLASITPATTAFSVNVNSVARAVSSVSTSETKVLLTLASPVVYGDIITFAYTKPSTNPIQTPSGGQAASLTAQSVKNNCTAPANQSPTVSISSPAKSTAFISPATITIDAVASDSDGSISKVEFFNGSTKLGERTTTPYSFTWKEVFEGTYSLTAVATDNLNTKTISAAVSVVVEKAAQAINQFPAVRISSPENESSFESPATVTFTANASDADGVVSKVEYFNGNTKIGESLSAPWPVSFECTKAGTYDITAVVTDNLSAVTSSSVLKIFFTYRNEYPDIINLFPNPNNGLFSIDLSSPLPDEKNTVSITSLSGHTVYYGVLEEGGNTRQFDLSHSSTGQYIVIITSGNRIVATRKFIKN